MQTKFKIKPYDKNFKNDLIKVWENSVRATHTFLDPKDIDYFKTLIESMDLNALSLFCLTTESALAGFIGVADKKVEMLFLDPKYMNRGLGKRLMQFAMTELNADKVDVNEQNSDAVRFYKKLGFVTYDRTEKDSSGKDY